jgi:hypothetical protein
MDDEFWLGEAKIDGDSRRPILLWPQTSPTDEIAANAAEVEGKRPRPVSIGCEPIAGGFDTDLPPVIAVSP